MKNNQTIRVLLIAIVLAVGAGGTLIFASFFLNQQTVEVSERMQTIADEQAVLKEQAQLASIITKTETDRAALSTYVLQGDDGTVTLLSKVDDVADQLGVELTTNALSVEDVKDSQFDVLLLTFGLNGVERDVKKMITLLENIPYANEITQMEMRRVVDRTTGLPQMQGTISLRVSIVEL